MNEDMDKALRLVLAVQEQASIVQRNCRKVIRSARASKYADAASEYYGLTMAAHSLADWLDQLPTDMDFGTICFKQGGQP